MKSHIASAVLPPDTQIVTINEGEPKPAIGSSAFGNLGRRVKTLRALCAERGVDSSAAGTVTLAGFSAGWGLYEQLFRDPETLARVDALVACDSYYTGEAKTPHRGFLAFCEKAAQSKALAIFTTSWNRGPNYPSSAASVEELVRPFELEPRAAPQGLPAPVTCKARGGLVWLDYQNRFSHGQHATELAPRVLSTLATPYVEQRKDGSSAELALLAIGLLLVSCV